MEEHFDDGFEPALLPPFSSLCNFFVAVVKDRVRPSPARQVDLDLTHHFFLANLHFLERMNSEFEMNGEFERL